MLQEAEIDKFENDPDFVVPDRQKAAHRRWLYARKKIVIGDLFGPYPQAKDTITAVAVERSDDDSNPDTVKAVPVGSSSTGSWRGGRRRR